MLKNYLLVAWRNLEKQKLFSMINVFGLAIGLYAFFLIIFFVTDEFSANNWIKNADRQYMIESSWKKDVKLPEFTTLAPLGQALRENYPTLVANYFSIDAVSCNISDGGDKSFRMGLQIGDSTLIEMFGLPLIHGNLKNALDNPDGVVIQKEVALKFFGKTDVIGQSLILETQNANYNPSGMKEFLITGVIDDLPENSITDNLGYRNDVYINRHNIMFFRDVDFFSSWDVPIIQTRIELQPGVKPEDLIAPMQALISKNAPPNLAERIQPKLTPLKSYNLTQNNGTKQKLLYILMGSAFFILLMALINFVNISLGMAKKRMKEIGVRKAIGGLKSQLVFQFLTEATILTMLAFLLSMSLVQLTLPYYAHLINKPLTSFSNVHFLHISGILFLVALIVGILSGIYPAFILSRQSTVKALKGKMVTHSSKIDLKKALLTVQFLLALFFMISAVMVSKQVDFMLTKDKGYDARDILVVSSVPRWYSAEGVQRMLAIKNEFSRIAEVEEVSLSYEVLDGRHGTQIDIKRPEGEDYESFGVVTADSQYLKTYGLQLQEGRFYAETDRQKPVIIINQTAASLLFGSQSAIGQLVSIRDNPNQEVIGVVKDFNFSSLHDQIGGIVFNQLDTASVFRYMSFKINKGSSQSATNAIHLKWQEIFPQVPFEYFFMEDKITELYKSETQFQKIILIASLFAFFIV